MTVAGAGTIGVSLVRGASVVDTLVAESPLRLLAPANHGLAAWIFAASLGGGLVDGDRIEIGARVGARAAALVGTQAQTKVYRSPNGCAQRVDAVVETDGLLVLLPDPVVCFAGANYVQETRIKLDPESSLIALEALTSGRSGFGERWQFGRCRTRTVVERAGRPLVVDGVLLDPAHGALAERMGRFEAMASVVAVGPRVAGVRADLAAVAPKIERRADVVAAIAPLAHGGEDGVILRLAGASVEAVTDAVRAALRGLAVLLGDDPFARKW